MTTIQFDLSYSGLLADDRELDFYDVAIALIGFQRSLAITTHLVINDEVITQAPALKGAQILAVPPQAGSWKFTALVVAGMFSLGTASRDSALGNLVASAYDYIVSETLGFHVDFHKTLGQQYDELKRERSQSLPLLEKSRFDSAAEKCEVAIRDMHRPIVKSETAEEARITAMSGPLILPFNAPLTRYSYDNMLATLERPGSVEFEGKVSSYNVNTFKGRVFIGDASRPISFELADEARQPRVIAAVTRSLDANARSRSSLAGVIRFTGIPLESRTGRLRAIILLDVLE